MRQRGVTLIELVITITVIAIAVSAVLGTLAATSKSSSEGMARTQAMAIAEAYLEEIRLKPCVDPDGTDGESGRVNFDDVDDYNGLNYSAATDQFGNAIAAIDELLVIGADWYGTNSDGNDNPGAVYVFDRNSGDLLQTLLDPFPNPNDSFGHSIIHAGELIVVATERGGDLLVYQRTPEPNSIALAAMGASAIALVRRRRKPPIK